MFISQHVAGAVQPKRDWYTCICSEFTLVDMYIEFTPVCTSPKKLLLSFTRWINCGV